jgi:hypothetical protein
VAGVGWAAGGGECKAIRKEKDLSADGIENCISVLKQLEDEKIKDVEFIELNACPGGCVGGVLNIENPFIAKSKIRSLQKHFPKRKKNAGYGKHGGDEFLWDDAPEVVPVFRLDEDRGVAMLKMQRVEEILAGLPGLDCGDCGAPSCRAFAEDVINGLVPEGGCRRRDSGQT